MTKAAYLSFREVAEPIKTPTTKFGGQPVWLTAPEWPINEKTGKPLLFVGQVELDSRIFGGTNGRFAYIFVADSSAMTANVGSHWSGNAVVIQPGPTSGRPLLPVREGPSVCRLAKGERRWLFRERIAVPCECAVDTIIREEPEIDWEEDDLLADFPFDFNQSKIGGQPIWIQGKRWPYDQPTQLLLQLVSGSFPFHINLGDAGTMYAFLSPDGSEARIAWQCG